MSDRPNQEASTEDFEFEALQRAGNYRAAIVSEFAPHLKGNVIEVGAGIGQFTVEFARLPSVARIVAIEPDSRFCNRFRQLHPEQALIEGTIDDLPPGAGCDAIVCVNVLEHIRDDGVELAKYRSRISDRAGHLCLFVPARQEIYAPIDRDFGHYRRYGRKDLRAKLETAGFRIVRLNYFNSIGYFAWWFNFCLLRKRHFDPASVALFDQFAFPVVRFLEQHLHRPPFGQSLLAVASAG
jgi:SAM-dependent methyltransferase